MESMSEKQLYSVEETVLVVWDAMVLMRHQCYERHAAAEWDY